MADYEPASSDLGSQALLKLRISFVLHSHTMARHVQSTIDLKEYREAIIRCARDSADKHVKEADQHLKEAIAIMAEAQEPIQKILAKAQEPIFQFDEVLEMSDEDMGLDNQSHWVHANGGKIRPSKAPRLR